MNIITINSMKRLYRDGIKPKEDFIQRVVEGTLTKEEYFTITGEKYKENA